MACAQILTVKRLQIENFDKATLTLKSRVY